MAGGTGRAAARAGGVGRPALGRPDHAGVPRARDRAGAHGVDAARPDGSPHVSPALAAALSPHLARAQSLGAPAGRDADCSAGRRQSPSPPALSEVVQHIVTKTDGVPLYVEELTKVLLASRLLREEAGQYVLTGPLRTVTIPDTLQDALMARLDQLPAPKEIAQLGAALGREFTYELMRSIAPQDEASLKTALEQLVAAELLYQRGRPPKARYVFKHALIRDAAYASLLKSTRQQLHQRTAQVLEAQFPEVVATQPELLARHLTEAGHPAEAVGYWQRAGERAVARSAHLEAISHLTTGLAVLQTLPENAERIQQELLLQTTLGPALMMTKGFAAPEAEHAYARARALCQRVGETPKLFSVLRGLWQFYNGRGAYQTARELGEQCLQLAQQGHDTARLLEAHHTLWTTGLLLGELRFAHTHLEEGLTLLDP